ncbi:MAG TPA: META domain-containing protein [Allosphingosinicella sp.]|jgi:heat shock protein HslJ/uncharacterized membrane protein|nr:META domain-containing protein [Allosphingosinicella sp.]
MYQLLFAVIIAAPAASAQAQSYRAVGVEQNWTLTIADGVLRFERPGHEPVSAPASPPERTEYGDRYQAGPVTVETIPYPCRDPLSGARYRDSVEVTVSGEEFGGCGGRIFPADSLEFTSWHFSAIDGHPTQLTGDLLRDGRYAVDFGPGMLVGYSGCNRFHANYVRDGNRLTVSLQGRGITRCAPPIGPLEQRLFEILSQPLEISFADSEALTLSGPQGSIRLKRSDPDE